MSWQKYLLLPQVIWHAVRAPKGEVTTWERYWGDIDRTGEHGEVLWDAGIEPEMRHAREWLLRYADRTLPLVDVGCGNGRRTRALAPSFPSALGVDLSARAIERARAESRSDDPAAQARVAFRTLDVAAPGAGAALAGELGDANVYIRGVLHIVEHERRVALLANVRRLLGERGTLYYLETDFPGDLLDYMQSLGARPGDIPEPLKRCLAYGLNRPSQFGPDEHRVYFPEGQWETLASGPADVHAVPMHADDRLERIAGYFAVVRPRPPAPPGRQVATLAGERHPAEQTAARS
ncbi:MAG TPA: class I SAM-dependent methyltransferase [Chloroflexota bacterium]|nr:class I SAM-dependent methyltransferase [Chloroflexota bacterium]